MPVVGLAEVLIQPSFKGAQRAISKEVGPAADRAGRDAGSRMGKGMAKGLASETGSLEAEVERLASSVSAAEDRVAAAREKTATATAKENKALGDLRVAELRLQELQESGRAKASQLAAAEERIATARDRVSAATMQREKADRSLTNATDGLTRAQDDSSRASADLETHLKNVAAESSKTERGLGRLGAALRNAFQGRPLGDIARSIRDDSDRINLDLHQMAQRVSQQGTRGGRAFTQGFLLVAGGLSTVIPLAGAAGAALGATAATVLVASAAFRQLGGAAALAPAGLLAAGAAAGVARAAFAGIGEALKTATEQTQGTGASARLEAMALADASRQVAKAEQRAAEVRMQSARQVEDAQRALRNVVSQNAEQQASALRRVADAERTVERANRSVLESQLDLNQARADAVQRVKDLTQSLERAGLSEREAAFRYEDALTAFTYAKTDGATSKELERLQLDLDQATFALRTAREETAELRGEQAQAAKDGVNGNRRVQQAEQSLVDARDAATEAVRDRQDAVRELAQTEEENAERVADAQRALADATAQATAAQVDAAEAVADAHRGLERVHLQQGAAAADAMAELTPAAQAGVRALLDVYDQLGKIRRIAQEAFFTGFAAPLLNLASVVMPQLSTGVAAMATVMGTGAQQLMNSLSGGLGGGVLERMLLILADSLSILNGAIDPLVQSFITLGVVGMEYMPRLATAVSDMASGFNEFIQTAAANGELNRWIEDGIQGFKDLGSILGSIGGIFSGLTEAARTAGIDTTLGSMADALNRAEAVVNGATFQETLSTILRGASEGMAGLGEGMQAIGEAFRVGAPALSEFLRLGGEIAGTFIGGIFTALSNPEFGAGLNSFLEAVQRGVEELVPLLPGLTSAFGRLLDSLGPIFEQLGPSLVSVFSGVATAIAGVVTFLNPLLSTLAGSPLVVGLFIAAFGGTAAVSAFLTFAGNLQRVLIPLKFLPKVLGLAKAGIMGLSAAMKANPVGAIIAGITLLVTALVWFFTQTEIGQQIVAVAWAAIQAAASAVADWFTGTLVPALTAAWEGIKAGAMWLYEHGIKPAFAAIGAVVSFWWQNIVQPILSGAVWFFQNVLAPVFTWLYENIIKPVFDRISSVISMVWNFGLKPVFEAMARIVRDDLPTAFQAARDGITRAWDAIKEAAKTPVRFVVETVLGGLVNALNKIPGVDLPKPKLPEGFRKGGYTGDMREDEVAGVVHGREFVMNAKATAAIGKEKLTNMARVAVSGGRRAAASLGEGNKGGFFEGNAAAIRRHGAYFLDVPGSMRDWGFDAAARMWDGAAGLKVAVGRGNLQARATPRERGAGILGYTTGNDIDMSPMWMRMLGPIQRRTVAAHELGHALGLPHNSSRSIMQPNLANMATAPTAVDIRNLQHLFPGGSGKSGDPAPVNPLIGLVNGLIAKIKAHFPEGGMFVDAAGGFAKQGIEMATKWVQDIKDGIRNIAGEVADRVRGFFGGGPATADPAAAPLFRDNGGILPPGLSQVLNATGRDEYVLNTRQWRDIHRLATARTPGSGGDTWNVQLPQQATVSDLMDAVSFERRRNARVGAGR